MPELTELQDLPDAPLATYKTPVVMVGGGAVDDAQLETLARHYPLIAVDSGANHIHDMGPHIMNMVSATINSDQRIMPGKRFQLRIINSTATHHHHWCLVSRKRRIRQVL